MGNSLKKIIERIIGTKTDSLELTVDKAAPDKLTDFEKAKIEPTNKSERKKPKGIRSVECVELLSEKKRIRLIIEATK